MTLAKRIIPCLDVKDGMVVKGEQFRDLQISGSIVELAERYSREGADELVFLDISASLESRRTRLEWVEEVARHIQIPFTVGGGITSEKDVEALLARGADKISVNTSALQHPSLITRLAGLFGSQCVVAAIDARPDNGQWEVYSHGGHLPAGKELYSWAKEVEDLGAGEILFTAINRDGTCQGFATEAIARLTDIVNIPVIASGGAGCKEDFLEVFTRGRADAALAAGTFHSGKIRVPELKTYLRQEHINIR